MISNTVEKYKQQEAKQAETNFVSFCRLRKIECLKLDISESKPHRQRFLIQLNGKCPDYWCMIGDESDFVEIKTQTHFPNKKTEKIFNKAVETSRNNGNSVHSSGSFDYIAALKGPIIGILKDASKKFKNIKKEYTYPRILLLNGVFGIELIAKQIFIGTNKDGLFYKTGSNVSAVIYWNEGMECFNVVGNPQAKIELSKCSFDIFFKKSIHSVPDEGFP